MNRLVITLLIVAILAIAASAAGETDHCPLCDTATAIDGELVSLDRYIGNVVLAVNTASKCGFTPQYGPLQDIHEKYRERGLVVLGFPCNQFKNQEPGTEEEIMEFCRTEFGVTFPMFSKIDVNGDDAHPLYAYLTSDSLPVEDRGAVMWNFEKFLFDRTGRVIARFLTRSSPDSPEVIEAIETALGPEPVESGEKKE